MFSDGSADAALDYDGTATITAGTVIAVGNSGMAQNFGTDSTQGSILVNFNSNVTGDVSPDGQRRQCPGHFLPGRVL